MDFWARLETVRERWNVLDHPFYRRWSSGELSAQELSAYSGQYRHAVVALAEASEHAAEQSPALAEHAREERSHVALWDEFARTAGGDTSAEAAPETAGCAAAWAGDGDRPLAETLVALYSIESGQPAISETKRAGLLEHYGFEDGPATEYFTLHVKRDKEHAAEARQLIDPLLADADEDALIGQAESVLRGNWELLDGMERRRRPA